MDSLRSHLEREGLGKYAELFAEHSIGVDVLADLTEADLEKLGILMGDRRRFLKAAWRVVAVDAPQTYSQSATHGSDARARRTRMRDARRLRYARQSGLISVRLWTRHEVDGGVMRKKLGVVFGV